MNALWKLILGLRFWKWLGPLLRSYYGESSYQHGRKLHNLKIHVKRLSLDFIIISIGVFLAGFGLQGFLLPNQFIDGGVVGISLMVSEISGWHPSTLLPLINAPFIIMGFKTIGKEFAVKTALAIIALSLAVAFIPYPTITADKLLVAVFGGFFLGAGIGMAVRGGGVIDGTEVLAIFLSRRIGLTIGDIILLINILIFSLGAWLLSLETAMYAILTYLAASKTVQFIIEGIEEYTGVTIVSVKSEELRKTIIEGLGAGVTVYKGERGFHRAGIDQKDIDILFTVVTRLEVNKLSKEIEKIDPNAFVIMNSIKDSRGGMIKKRPLSH